MAFGFQKSSGDFLPIVKYDAKDGRISKRDSVAGPQGFEKTDTDITDTFSAVIDLENIQTGWVYFTPNEGPKRVMSTYLKDPMPERPADKDPNGKPLYRQGFTIHMALGKQCGGGIYEMTGNSNMLVEAMGTLHDEYLKGTNENPGRLPVVVFNGARKEQTKFGNFYRPSFSIETWSNRPAGLKQGAKKQDAAANGNGSAFSGPPATGKTTMKAPPPKAAQPVQAEASADDFG